MFLIYQKSWSKFKVKLLSFFLVLKFFWKKSRILCEYWKPQDAHCSPSIPAAYSVKLLTIICFCFYIQSSFLQSFRLCSPERFALGSGLSEFSFFLCVFYLWIFLEKGFTCKWCKKKKVNSDLLQDIVFYWKWLNFEDF